jgi:hypothetical protein
MDETTTNTLARNNLTNAITTLTQKIEEATQNQPHQTKITH